MKIKLSKTLAIALALCLTFAGFSAFAADVEIVTSYDYTQAADAQVSVTSKVNGMTEGDEVTYYVSAGDEIVYINQETAPAGGVVEFDTFSAAWNKLTASKVVFGSDANWSEGDFTFVPAGNYKTSGSAAAAKDDTAWKIVSAEEVTLADGTVEENVAGYSFTAKVSGNYKEYGIKITLDNAEIVSLPALGCSEDGTYTVFVGSISEAEADTVVAYAN